MAMSDSDYVRAGFYSGGSASYNFPLELMNDCEDLYNFAYIGKSTDEEIGNGAILLITEKQYVLSYNRGMGQGAHNNAIARAYADMAGIGQLDFKSTVKTCLEAEDKLLLARLYSERMGYKKPLENMIVFSFKRGKNISQQEYNSFLCFYDEYARVFRSQNFKISIGSKDYKSIEEAKLVLESMIDPNLDISDLFTNGEKIIGTPTTEKKEIIR